MNMRSFAISLAVAALLPTVAAAQPAAESTASVETSRSWMVGIAPRVGLTIPTSKLGPMVVGGLEVDYVLPVGGGHVVVAADVSLTRPSSDGSVTDSRIGGEGSYDIDTTELKIGLGGVYRIFGFDRALVPFVGGGPILHMLKTTETTSFAPGENTSQNTELGFELLGGADYRLGPGFVLGEVRFLYSDLDQLFTGNSNAGNVAISVGYRVAL